MVYFQASLILKGLPLFIPTTPEEVKELGWSKLDVILVSGDTYIDSPYSGTAIIGKRLMAAGYRVGVIAQPSVVELTEISRLGEPALFWGVTGGTVDRWSPITLPPCANVARTILLPAV